MSRNPRDDDREARLAEALRANLRRRKAQTRAQAAARSDAPDHAGPDGDSAPEGDAAPAPPSERR